VFISSSNLLSRCIKYVDSVIPPIMRSKFARLGSALPALSSFCRDFFFGRIFKPKHGGVLTRLKSKDFHSTQDQHVNLRYRIRIPFSPGPHEIPHRAILDVTESTH
jgi:hypothetical protein